MFTTTIKSHTVAQDSVQQDPKIVQTLTKASQKLQSFDAFAFSNQSTGVTEKRVHFNSPEDSSVDLPEESFDFINTEKGGKNSSHLEGDFCQERSDMDFQPNLSGLESVTTEPMQSSRGLGQLHVQYAEQIYANFTQRIHNFKESQEKFLQNFPDDSSSERSCKAFVHQQKIFDRIQRDIIKAQLLHPEMSNVFQEFASELLMADMSHARDQQIMGIDSFLSIQILMQAVASVKFFSSTSAGPRDSKYLGSFWRLFQCRKSHQTRHVIKLKFAEPHAKLLQSPVTAAKLFKPLFEDYELSSMPFVQVWTNSVTLTFLKSQKVQALHLFRLLKPTKEKRRIADNDGVMERLSMLGLSKILSKPQKKHLRGELCGFVVEAGTTEEQTE